MTEREQLLRAILESPDDHDLKLVYADALEEEGDEKRAAFIRHAVYAESAIERNRDLWFGMEVVRDLRPRESSHSGTMRRPRRFKPIGRIRGGLVDAVMCEFPWWLEHGPKLIRENPISSVQIDYLELDAHTNGSAGGYLFFCDEISWWPEGSEILFDVMWESCDPSWRVGADTPKQQGSYRHNANGVNGRRIQIAGDGWIDGPKPLTDLLTRALIKVAMDRRR